ncbi:hypothetical protein Tco_0324445 [Tanacetum coccineum]
MIGTLIYLTASRPDLTFDVCMCAWGLWYPKDSSIALTAYADADHAGCQDTRRSTSRSMQLLGERLVSWSSKRQKSAVISSTKAEYIAMSGSSYSSDVIPTVVQSAAPYSEHVTKWTKDHPLDNIIGELERPNKTSIGCRVNRSERGIDFEESFAPVARLDAIRIFLAYACPHEYGCLPNGCKDGILNASAEENALMVKQAPRACDPVDTPMVEKSKLDEDTQGKAVDPTHYRGMIGTLMYLTASRPDLTFDVCMLPMIQDEVQLEVSIIRETDLLAGHQKAEQLCDSRYGS